MSKLYLLDFDRTLFDTASFQRDLGHVLSPDDPDRFHSHIPHYTDKATAAYSVYAQARDLTGLTDPEITQLILTRMPQSDYCFPDVAPWVSSHQEPDVTLFILTVGSGDYQGLKLRFAPALTRIANHITTKNKSRLLVRELNHQTPPLHLSFVPGTYTDIVLVDDHPGHLDGLSALPGVKPVRMIRAGDKYSSLATPSSITTIINSLGDLP